MKKTLSRSNFVRGVVCVALSAALGCVTLVGCASNQADTSKPAEQTPATSEQKADETKTPDKKADESKAPEQKAEEQKASEQTAESSVRTIKDMGGNEVVIPEEVTSVATFGSVGVLNAFVECMGKGDLIVNQMPENFTKNDKWAMQYKFAPQIADGPVLETPDGIIMEEVMKLNPDVCLTMMPDMAQQLRENGMNAVLLQWNDTEDVKVAVELMGEIFGVQDRADDYNAYFDEMVAKAQSLTEDIPSAERPTALYGDVTTLTNPHIISEWWIEAAGGVSVTAEDHQKGSLEYTMEQLLAWQPQVIFSSNSNLESITSDENLASLPAIQDGKVYAVPTVAHVWGNRTVEQPLTVMWALNKLYPEKYSTEELSQDIEYYYDHFFNYKMSPEEIDSIINYR